MNAEVLACSAVALPSKSMFWTMAAILATAAIFRARIRKFYVRFFVGPPELGKTEPPKVPEPVYPEEIREKAKKVMERKQAAAKRMKERKQGP